MEINCDPVYGKVDNLLEILTKSKSLHILLELYKSKGSMNFTKLKFSVDSSGTTVSRRLSELEECGLLKREVSDANAISYTLTEKSALKNSYFVNLIKGNISNLFLSPLVFLFYDTGSILITMR